jgi:hypothetical protein
MLNPTENLEKAARLHRARLAAYEVREDFPLLRLNKSVNAYRIIAAFESIPMAQRSEVALAFINASGGTVKPENERLLKEAFHLQKSKHTIEELEAMALKPAPLDLYLEEGRFRELRGDDILSAIIRKSDESLERTEIRKCFLERFEKVCEGGFLRAQRDGKFYEMDEKAGGWTLVTRLEFEREPMNQFDRTFQVKHEQMQGRVRFSLGGLLGLGDLRWNDIRRETLDEDAQKAFQLWGASTCVMEIIIGAESKSTRQD